MADAIQIHLQPDKNRIQVGVNPIIHLDDATLYALADKLRAAALKRHKASGSGVFTIAAALAYSDISNDQDTAAYHWEAQFRGTRAAALVIADRVTAELAPTRGFRGTVGTAKDDPAGHDGSAMTAADDVIADLRSALLAHQSDSIVKGVDAPYWAAVGFTPEEVDELDTHVAFGTPRLFDDVGYEDDPLPHLQNYCQDLDDSRGWLPGMPREREEPLFVKLARWVAGEDLTRETPA